MGEGGSKYHEELLGFIHRLRLFVIVLEAAQEFLEAT